MKLAKLISGLSLSGKCVLGAGVAFASTAGAGAAGALPGPVQHAFSAVVGTNDRPKLSADPATHPHDTTEAPDSSGTSSDVTEPTEPPKPPEPTTAETHAPEPTTVAPGPSESTTVPSAEPGSGQHDGQHGGGDHHGDGTPPPTSEHPNEGQRPPQTVVLTCSVAGAAVHCSWSGDALPDGAHYVLLRVGGVVEHRGRAFLPGDGATTYDDTMLEPGAVYHYMVIVLIGDAHHPVGISNRVEVHAPGEPGTGGSGGGSDGGPGSGGPGSGDHGGGTGSGDHGATGGPGGDPQI